MVDGIRQPPPIMPNGPRPAAPQETNVQVRADQRAELDERRRRQQRRQDQKSGGKARTAYGGKSGGADPQDQIEFSIDQATSLMLEGDLSLIIDRAAIAIQELSEWLLDADKPAATILSYRFRQDISGPVEEAVRSHGLTRHKSPIEVVAFTDVEVRHENTSEAFAISCDGIELRHDHNMHARGIVFDFLGTRPVHHAEGGFLIDIGSRGAATADHFISRIREQQSPAPVAPDIGEVCVLIRAEKSDYSAVDTNGGRLVFDVLVPLVSWRRGKAAPYQTPSIAHVDLST